MLIKMLKELKEGQTHYFNDNCGEKEHNKDTRILEHNEEVRRQRFEAKWGRIGEEVCKWGAIIVISYMVYLAIKYFNII